MEFADRMLKCVDCKADFVFTAGAHQAGRFGGGVFVGSVEAHMAQQERQFVDQTAAFPDEPGLDDLARALRRFT